MQSKRKNNLQTSVLPQSRCVPQSLPAVKYSGLILTYVLLTLISNNCFADIYKCTSPNGDILFTLDPKEAREKNCAQITITPNVVSPPPPSGAASPPNAARSPQSNIRPQPAPKLFSKRDIEKFRENLKKGDRSTAGVVVEVKPPTATVRTKEGDKSFWIDKLEPAR